MSEDLDAGLNLAVAQNDKWNGIGASHANPRRFEILPLIDRAFSGGQGSWQKRNSAARLGRLKAADTALM
jgi:hypothetical protein